MSKKKWKEVDRFIGKHLIPADDALDAAIEAAQQAGLPPISVSPPQGKFLFLLAQAIGAKSILELGTLAGYSAIWMARALPKDGRLITVEADREHVAVARKNLVRAGLDAKVEVRLGKALSVLKKLKEEDAGPFDLIFLDADKANIPNYVALALPLARPGSLMIVDNVVRDGALADKGAKDPDVQGVRELHKMLAKEKRLVATTIQTVGSKGYDGFTLARVV